LCTTLLHFWVHLEHNSPNIYWNKNILKKKNFREKWNRFCFQFTFSFSLTVSEVVKQANFPGLLCSAYILKLVSTTVLWTHVEITKVVCPSVQNVHFIVFLSIATVTGASSHRKPASARNLGSVFPLYFSVTLLHRRTSKCSKFLEDTGFLHDKDPLLRNMTN
jgi:hypothetical protein